MPESQEPKIEETWKEYKNKLQATWASVTDVELDQFEGKLNELVDKIREQTGDARETIREQLKKLADNVGYSFD